MSVPLADVRLLLLIARHVMTEQRSTVDMTVQERYGDGFAAVLNVRLPHDLYREWKRRTNAPYDGDLRELEEAAQLAERDALDWAEALNKEAILRTGGGCVHDGEFEWEVGQRRVTCLKCGVMLNVTCRRPECDLAPIHQGPCQTAGGRR